MPLHRCFLFIEHLGFSETIASYVKYEQRRGAGLLDPVLEQLQKSQAAFCVLDDLPPEPSYGQVQKLVDACRAEGAVFVCVCMYHAN